MTVCAACGGENPDGFRFCGSCGAALVTPAAPREVRKVVTIVFCDLTASTAFGDHTDPEALRATMRSYYEQMRAILERHGGTVEKFIGDAVMAVFGVPVAHEDDALRAVRAAWEMRVALPALGLAGRIGVNTGEIVAGEGDSLVTGDAVNVAARLEQNAATGEVLIGAATRRLVRDAVTVDRVEVVVKGKSAPISAFRLVELDPTASGIARRLDTPLVGRSRELGLLRQAYASTVSERSCHLVTVLGPAGVGKSRLVAEFLAAVEATVARGSCLDYGEGITFWPLIEILRRLGAEDTIEAIADGSVHGNELFLAVRRRLEAMAAERPLVLVFEDVHWAEPMLLDLLDHIADLSRTSPMLLLCVARPELLDDRPAWSGGKLNATTFLLEPLSAGESVELLDALGAEAVPAAARATIVETAGGNPLFVEEMLALALEGGDVRAPSTIHALLQARLDRLARPERAVIERGAVEGEVFHRGAVTQMVNGSSDGIDSELVGLVRKELIRPERTIVPGEDAYRFRHLLIRDAAYEALPKETRADLHLRFADWLQARADLVELDEIVGYHLEQASRNRRELGFPDQAVEERAAERLAAAGSKALARGDLPAADNLLARAVVLLPVGHPRRADALIERLAVLETHGTLEERASLAAELEGLDEPVARMHGTLGQLSTRIMSAPQAVVPELRRAAHEALELFEAVGDERGLAQAWFALFWIEWLGSRGAAAIDALDHVLVHADRAGSQGLRNAAYVTLAGAAIHAPITPAEIRRRLEALRGRGPLATHSVFLVDAHLMDLEGRFDEAHELHRQADELVADLGLETMRALSRQRAADTLYRQGRLDETVELLQSSAAELEALGHASFRSTTLVRIGVFLYLLGLPEEAERYAIEGEELGAAEDVVNFALGRGVRAKIAADRGDRDEAASLAASSLHYAYETDFPSVHAYAHEANAQMLLAVGRVEEARTERERELERYESIGDEFEAERTRALLVEL